MTSPAGRDRLHSLVDNLVDAEALEVIDFLEWLREPSELSDWALETIRQSSAEFGAGEFVTLEDVKRELAS